MQAEDILSDAQNTIEVDGKKLRKGSVAAFLANCQILQSAEPDSKAYEQALNDARTLLPILHTLKLFEIFDFKDSSLKSLIEKSF